MSVAELKELLDGFPDSVPVLLDVSHAHLPSTGMGMIKQAYGSSAQCTLVVIPAYPAEEGMF